jgi:hypothetical protein
VLLYSASEVIADLSGGVERKRTVCRSAYEVTDADKPRFKYTNQMVATPESEAFLKASTGKAAQDDKEFAEVRISIEMEYE